MGFLSGLLKSKKVRATVESSVGASAHTPVTGFASGDNSRGASKTSVEVSRLLASCFDDFDSDDDLMNNIDYIHRHLNEKASQYSNTGLPIGTGKAWQPNRDLITLTRVAIECSVNVYSHPALALNLQGISVDKVKEFSPSLNAVTKATSVFKVRSSDGSSNSYFPVLVIAIRGTEAKSLDWMVNLNREAKNAENFLSSTDAPSYDQSEVHNIEAHAGFLNGAVDLETTITKELREHLSSSIKHVLFTGHSGGGAVAALSFLHFLGIAAREFTDTRFSLITFGCPPLLSRNLNPLLNQLVEKQTNPGLALAIINEHDPISRADASYGETMTELYNSSQDASQGHVRSRNTPWPIVSQDLHPVGDLIVLKDISTLDSKNIHGFKVEPDDFGQLIFCDRKMHKKVEYLENIKLLQGERENAVENFS